MVLRRLGNALNVVGDLVSNQQELSEGLVPLLQPVLLVLREGLALASQIHRVHPFLRGERALLDLRPKWVLLPHLA